MKLFVVLIFVILLFVSCCRWGWQAFEQSDFFEIDYCLDRGGCWDYTRRQCETEDQGYCIRTEKDCENDFHGVWDFKRNYCIMDETKR